MKLLLYCTKAKPYLYKTEKPMIEKKFGDYHTQLNEAILTENLNGKIVAECDFEVEDIELIRGLYIPPYLDTYNYVTKTIKNNTLVDKACLTYKEMEKYFGKLNYGGKNGYAIHIKNLHIFDEPKKLSECMSIKTFENEFVKKTLSPEMISKAPQNMMKVKMWVDYKEYGIWKNYCLISIKPEWLCKILNGEKTIEIRKKVLKEMLE